MKQIGLIYKVRRWLLTAPLVALCSQATPGDFEAGRAAYLQGDYRTALSRFFKSAEAGHQDAQFRLAEIYHEGMVVERDESRAAYWYRKAAERGNTEAQYWLCVMYREGIGVGRDYAEAFYWCKRAAEQGHAQALFAVGQYYFDGLGHGFHRDYLRAYIWFNRAQTQGDEEAAAMLERLEEEMTPLQVIEAKRLASDWKPR